MQSMAAQVIQRFNTMPRSDLVKTQYPQLEVNRANFGMFQSVGPRDTTRGKVSESDRHTSHASCHQCKKTKITIELLYCTFSPEPDDNGVKSRRCRKKFCDLCLKRYLHPEIVRMMFKKQTAAILAGLVFKWNCPSCTNECSCATCERLRGKQVPKRKRRPEHMIQSDISGVGAGFLKCKVSWCRQEFATVTEFNTHSRIHGVLGSKYLAHIAPPPPLDTPEISASPAASPQSSVSGASYPSLPASSVSHVSQLAVASSESVVPGSGSQTGATFGSPKSSVSGASYPIIPEISASHASQLTAVPN
eukprot:268462_1